MSLVTAQAVALLIERAAALAAVPVEALRLVFIVENNGQKGPFRTDAVSAASDPARGLFQLKESAWVDARRMDRRLPSYESWDDPAMSAWAAALYLRFLATESRRLGHHWRFTPPVLYSMYNQGIAGFARILRGTKRMKGESGLAHTIVALGVKDATEN